MALIYHNKHIWAICMKAILDIFILSFIYSLDHSSQPHNFSFEEWIRDDFCSFSNLKDYHHLISKFFRIYHDIFYNHVRDNRGLLFLISAHQLYNFAII
jgi:hypothetical protein